MFSAAPIVDQMPAGLWSSGNLLVLPGGDLHFCTALTDAGSSVRTIEWNARELARGRKPVVRSHLEDDGAVILVPLRRMVAVVFALGLILAAASWVRSHRHA